MVLFAPRLTVAPGALQYTTRYWESQVSLAVVVDQTFTSRDGDFRARLFIDHRHAQVFFFALNLCGFS